MTADESEPAARCVSCGHPFMQRTVRRYCDACRDLAPSFPYQATAWQERAACLGMWDTFHKAGEGDPAALVDAVRVCRGCPVTDECLAHALTIERAKRGAWGYKPERWGVRGGTTAEQRARMRKVRAA